MTNIRSALLLLFVGIFLQADDNPALRRQWFVEQRASPDGALPGHLRLRALAQMESMIRAQSVRKTRGVTAVPNQWTSIGPQPTVGNLMTSGRVVALAVDPRNPDLVYLGAADGGVWKTTDGGTNWIPLFDAQPSMAIGSLAIDPQNSGIVYVGTGEADNCQPCYYGAGLLKSTDGGATWINIQQPFVDAVGRGAKIASIAVSPQNGQLVLAAVNATSTAFQGGNFGLPSGIFRSTDGGLTWSMVAGAGLQGSRVMFNSANPSQAFAAISGAYGAIPSTAAGIFVSNDAGATWAGSNGTGANAISLAGAGRIELALAPGNPNPQVLYVSVSNDSVPPGNLLGFYRSTDGGQSWTRLFNTPDYCSPQCWYGNTLAVDPTNPNTVFAGGLSLYRSLNGGDTWQFNGASLHVDHHDLQFASGGARLYDANDGGVWSTSNPRAAAIPWTSLNNTLAITQFYPGLSINPGDLNTAFGGVQDNGTQLYTGSTTWQYVTCGDGGWTAIDPSLTTTVYSSCQNVPPIQIEKSLDGGSTWANVARGIDTADSGRAAFIPPLVMDPSTPQRLYLGTYRLWQTIDGAATWAAISGDLSGGMTAKLNPTLRAIAVAPSDPQTVYVGASTGLVWVTSKVDARDPATYSNRSAGLPSRFVSQIQVDSATASTAYVSYSGFTGLVASDTQGHLFRTRDRGATWLDISGNLPNIPINDFALDPDVPGTIYVATDVGVFYTTDAGLTWNVLGTGLPRVVVMGVRLHRPSRTLRAATHGRGMWDIVVPLPANQNPAPGLKNVSPARANPGSQDQALVVTGAGFIAGSAIQWNGQPLATQVFGASSVGATVPAALLAKPTIARLTVVNPAPGGGVSNALTFAVTPQPQIAAGGVVNAASYGAPVVAGALASVFGTGFSVSAASATTLPLPVSLNSVTVRVNFNPAPLVFVSPQQINFEIPWEVAGLSQIAVTVSLAGIDGNSSTAQLAAAIPAIFSLNQQGNGPGAVLIANSALLAQPVSVAGARPAAKGESVSVFCTGLGAVDQRQLSGQPAPSVPANVTAAVMAAIGGQPATVSFAGLAPGFVGLYQVNVTVPLDAPSGDAVGVVLTVGGVASNTVTIAVQ